MEIGCTYGTLEGETCGKLESLLLHQAHVHSMLDCVLVELWSDAIWTIFAEGMLIPLMRLPEISKMGDSQYLWMMVLTLSLISLNYELILKNHPSHLSQQTLLNLQ